MDYTITKGKAEDYEDIIDFANYVFGVDFPSLLPKLYKDRKVTAQYHHIVKEGPRIKAMVGSFPLGLKVCDNYLKVAGIGSVSVHKYSRHSGYMKLLMNNAISEMNTNNCDMAVLGGQRQRYEYWGFTPCGIKIELNFNSSNIKHTHIVTKDNYEFIEYNLGNAIDLDKAIKLHASQITHAIREGSDFIDICSSWNNTVLFVYINGAFCGYICADEKHEKISEIVLTANGKIDEVITSFMKHFTLETMSMVMYLHRSEEFMKLSTLCESYTLKACCNIYIINYINVIKAFMDLKSTNASLCDGTLIIDVKEKGRYRIEVRDRDISVKETELPYDISLSHLEASALLFSPSSFINSEYKSTNPLIKAWFPLPLYFAEIDNL